MIPCLTIIKFIIIIIIIVPINIYGNLNGKKKNINIEILKTKKIKI
jgi:hypothetical protein